MKGLARYPAIDISRSHSGCLVFSNITKTFEKSHGKFRDTSVYQTVPILALLRLVACEPTMSTMNNINPGPAFHLSCPPISWHIHTQQALQTRGLENSCFKLSVTARVLAGLKPATSALLVHSPTDHATYWPRWQQRAGTYSTSQQLIALCVM